MLAHCYERVRDLLRWLRNAAHVCIGRSEATDVKRRLLCDSLDRVLFNWVDDWRHLQVLLLAEAENFGFRRHVQVDLFCGFDTGE